MIDRMMDGKMISVAMTYFNRKQHLINTLNSMTKSVYKNFEVIIVDDGSDDEHRIEDLQEQFNFIKIIRINPEQKTHTNPCIPFNIALGNTGGDIIILQNPECFHYDDVFSHVVKNIKPNKYLAYTVVNKDVASQLSSIDWNNNYQFEKNNILKIDINSRVGNHWYTHSQFRAQALNFCTAITRDDMKELNGFDERYANGIERDDVEFLVRIQRKKMNIVFVDNVLVIHQSHHPFYYSGVDWNELRNHNHNLFAHTTNIETTIKVNPNKMIIR